MRPGFLVRRLLPARANCLLNQSCHALICFDVITADDDILPRFSPRNCGRQIDLDATHHTP
jgi:hypothetical protein